MKKELKTRLVLIEGVRHTIYEGRKVLAAFDLDMTAIINTVHLKQEIEAIRIANYETKA